MNIISTAAAVAVELGALGKNANAKARKVVTHHAQLLETRVRANASGRPGPRVVTGDYRRAISRKVETKGTETIGYVGTNEPQGRRLEFGFTGVDSLGRFYDQPPFPHFGPAMDSVESDFIDALGDIGVTP